jgi:subtilisin family serine protease
LSERDLHGHGTFIAGQIAGALGGGKIVGIGPGLTVVNVKMVNKHGRLWFSWALPAIYYAAANHLEVINMSWAGRIDTSTYGGNLWWKAFQRATHFADQQGSLLVAAAGNNAQDITGTHLRWLPAELPKVMAVSATTFEDQLASYSNYGSTITLSAPGGEFPPGPDDYYPYLVVGAFSPDAVPGKFYAWALGTSFAAPKVAGTAGLILSLERLSVSQLKARLQQTAEDLGKPGQDEQFGFGLVDADAAVR